MVPAFRVTEPPGQNVVGPEAVMAMFTVCWPIEMSGDVPLQPFALVTLTW